MAESQGKSIWQVALVCGALLACALMIYSGIGKLHDSSWSLRQVQELNQELDRENKSLHRAVQRLRDDKQSIYRAVRREMDMVRPDEVVYQFGTDRANSGRDQKEAAR